jgi:uncharacterized protein (TIGR02186 family)
MRVLAALALLCCTTEARAQRLPDLATGITEESISVASDYRGARLTVFGVHWGGGRGDADVVVTLQGPRADAVVRRKRNIFGLWINTDPVRFSRVPTFFALASTRPIDGFLAPDVIWRLGLDPGALAQLEGATPDDTDPAAYRRALVRLKRRAGLYRESPESLRVRDNNAFTVPFIIPANAPVGVYQVNVHLFRGGELIREETSEIVVSRIGIEKTVYTAAQDRPTLYGFAVVVIAVLFGWAAAFVFRRR